MVSNIGIFLKKYSALSQYNDAHEPLHGIMVYGPVGRGGGSCEFHWATREYKVTFQIRHYKTPFPTLWVKDPLEIPFHHSPGRQNAQNAIIYTHGSTVAWLTCTIS